MDKLDFQNYCEVKARQIKRSTLAIERGFKDIQNMRGMYLNFARRKFNILADMPLDVMYTVGYAMMSNLDKIYSHDFIILFLKSLVEIREVRFIYDYSKAGSVKMKIGTSGVQASYKIRNDGDNKITASGDRKICHRVSATFNAIDLNTYLYQFYVFGILQDDITVIDVPEHFVEQFKLTSDGIVKTTGDNKPKKTEGIF